MRKCISCLFVILMTNVLVAKGMPEPYCSINDLPFDPQGWFSNDKQLSECLRNNEIETVIEVGSWLGSSTRFIAELLPDHGKVYAIDTWQGSSEHADDPRIPLLYQLFLSNVKHKGLTHKIVPIRMYSLEAAKALNIKADLIYIDASHDTQSVIDDINAWFPHLKKNGIMCGDDWLWPSVSKAVERIANERNLSIYASGNFWRLL